MSNEWNWKGSQSQLLECHKVSATYQGSEYLTLSLTANVSKSYYILPPHLLLMSLSMNTSCQLQNSEGHDTWCSFHNSEDKIMSDVVSHCAYLLLVLVFGYFYHIDVLDLSTVCTLNILILLSPAWLRYLSFPFLTFIFKLDNYFSMMWCMGDNVMLFVVVLWRKHRSAKVKKS